MISAHLALQHAYRIALTQAIKQALRLRVFSELSSPSFIIEKPIRWFSCLETDHLIRIAVGVPFSFGAGTATESKKKVE